MVALRSKNYNLPTRIVECIGIYIFRFKKKKKEGNIHKQKAKENKADQRNSVESLMGNDDIVWEFAV